MSYREISKELKVFLNPKRAQFSINYFPRGQELGDRLDVFYGCSVPQTRQIAKKFQTLGFVEIEKLLLSSYHEERLCGLMILRFQLDKAIKLNNEQRLMDIWNCYIENLAAVDHWDLVDESADDILGKILVFRALETMEAVHFISLTNFRDPADGFPRLDGLASSENIWHKRISIIAGFAFIKKVIWVYR
jgi:3-methyladenine DNA glycosylase AlkD